MEEAEELIEAHRDLILERLHGFEIRAQRFGKTVSQSSLPERGLLPIEPAVVFAPRKPVSNDTLAHDYRTLNAVASRRDAAEAFTDFSYGHGDARNQSRKCFGVLGGPQQPTPFRWTKSADEIIESVNSVLKRINRTGH
ncbi:MAG: hypothetical protein MJA32_06435 [Proteobacteria bacterium]|nr:hypothetical protein [Pseudomonadota bacterium]